MSTKHASQGILIYFSLFFLVHLYKIYYPNIWIVNLKDLNYFQEIENVICGQQHKILTARLKDKQWQGKYKELFSRFFVGQKQSKVKLSKHLAGGSQLSHSQPFMSEIL